MIPTPIQNTDANNTLPIPQAKPVAMAKNTFTISFELPGTLLNRTSANTPPSEIALATSEPINIITAHTHTGRITSANAKLYEYFFFVSPNTYTRLKKIPSITATPKLMSASVVDIVLVASNIVLNIITSLLPIYHSVCSAVSACIPFHI